jgi:threonine dehydratase
MAVDWAQIQQAEDFLRQHLALSRLVPASSLTRDASAPVFLKLESEMPTGSFKLRGALYALTHQMERGGVTEVVASSTGNHGAAVAYAAKLLGTRATIFLPRNANPVKRHRIQELSATLIEQGEDISDACEAAVQYSQRTGALFLNDASDPNVPAGAATIGAEIVSQLPEVGTVWVPIGDTALIRGIASAVKHLRRGARIIGVQAEQAPAYYLSWKSGQTKPTETCKTIADGLATRTPLPENVAAIRELVDDVRLVSEAEMLKAVRLLLLNEHVLAEPSGAASTAAWLSADNTEQIGPAVLVVSGSNISEEVLKRAICSQEDRSS